MGDPEVPPAHQRDVRCAVTGRPAESTHHRIHGNRSDNRPSNLLAVSGSGSTGGHGWIEVHWAMAHDAGWTVSKDDPRDLTEIPVFYVGGAGPWPRGWYLLDDEWGFAAWPQSVPWQERVLHRVDGSAYVLAELPPPRLPRIVRR